MALSNAERQRKFRERRKAERAATPEAGRAAVRTLPEIIASVPDAPAESLNGESLRAEALKHLARIQESALMVIELLCDEGAAAGADIARMMGVDLDPAGGISGAELYAHAERGGYSRRDLKRLEYIGLDQLPLSLTSAYAWRLDLERLRLWKVSVT